MYAASTGVHPLESVDYLNPRPGLRRWVAVNTATEEGMTWRESWISIHHDGSATVAAAVGGHPAGRADMLDGNQIKSAAIECAIADLMALVRTTAEATGNDEYDIRVGIECGGGTPLTILTTDTMGFNYDGVSIPLHRYTPVEMTVNAQESPEDFFWHVHNLAEDCVNQGGVSNVQMIHPPVRDDKPSDG